MFQRMLMTVLLLSLTTCGGADGGGGESDTERAQRAKVLASLSANVVLPTYREFATAAGALRDKTQAHAAAAGTSDAVGKLADAREAWKAAMATWQRAELLRFGPAGEASMFMGGQGIRDRIYAWPTLSTCRVDQELVAKGYERSDFFTASLVNVVGLSVLEYLLFNEATSNTCSAQTDINQNGSWAALPDAEKLARRANYAKLAAADIASRAAELRDAWETSGGAFATEFATAGGGSKTYSTAQSALNDVLASLLYLDETVKDLKLAIPAGISSRCAAATCPEALESHLARYSKEDIVANLNAFKEAYQGGEAAQSDAYGFDDLLIELGAGELADRIATQIDAALHAAQNISGTLEDALASNVPAVVALHDAVKTVTDDLKSQFVTVLNLDLPAAGDADND